MATILHTNFNVKFVYDHLNLTRDFIHINRYMKYLVLDVSNKISIVTYNKISTEYKTRRNMFVKLFQKETCTQNWEWNITGIYPKEKRKSKVDTNDPSGIPHFWAWKLYIYLFSLCLYSMMAQRAEYPSWWYKFDIKECDGKMLNTSNHHNRIRH